MKKTSYKDKTGKELVKALYEKRTTLRDMRFGTAGSKHKNTKEMVNIRKDIARIMTELNNKPSQE